MEQNTNPQVFISYSWDSDEHKEKVTHFVQGLRSSGIQVIYDKDLKLGTRLPHFMEDSILNSDFVLFICSPKYKKRADNRKAGVGYESQIITGELYRTSNEEKFIPILFDGTWESSLPGWAEGKLGIDLSSPVLYSVNFPKLLSHLQNNTPSADSADNATRYTETKAPSEETQSNEANLVKKSFVSTFFSPFPLILIIALICIAIYLATYYHPPSSPDDSPPNNSIHNSKGVDISSLPNGTMPKSSPLPEGTEEKLSFIQELTIGNSKQWIDEKLGPAFAEDTLPIKDDRLLRPIDDDEKNSELLVCAYNISNIVLVQAYFDTSNNSCQAFFVTLIEDIPNIDVGMPKAYTTPVSNKPLGEFTFADVGESPTYAYGFSGQGVTRAFYGEEHYLGPDGNYQDFYFAVLDYGMLSSLPDFGLFLSNVQLYIAPAIDVTEITLPKFLASQRSTFYPNTYGISTLGNYLTFDLLTDYYWFDSYSFRVES